jgi:DNA-binding response OmpR family regulator
MTHSILIVEDHAPTARFLKDELANAGYAPAIQRSGEEALAFIAKSPPVLVLLDINLGGISGLKVLEILRSIDRTRSIPVILLTARDQEADRVRGLRLGADDYVVKPFSEKELMARIEAVLRRSRGGPGPEEILRMGTLTLNGTTREVTARGRRVSLTWLEYELLALFLRTPRRVHSFQHLAEAVWGEERTATRHTIVVTVARLREKLGGAGKNIEPVPSVGYRFVPPDS